MGIQNFPAILQPIIQQGFLEREFMQAMHSRLGYRACADRQEFAVGIGETLTKTRAGLKPSVTTPLPPATNTNFDNGLTPQGWGVEQFTITINHYAATTDLNMVTSRVGIIGQFLQNARINGEQAARSLDELARNALFAPYFGGNTRVRVALSSAGPVVAVDDLRGFTAAFVNGVQSPVGATTSLTATIGSGVYTVVGTTADGVNSSTTPGGVSGTITCSTSVSVSDGALGNAVQAANASVIVRPGGRGTATALQAQDELTIGVLLDAVSKLRLNAVPDIGGSYNCYLDPVSARQLFADPDFRQLFQGATSANQVFATGMVNNFLGLRFIPTTEAYVQPHPTLPGAVIRRPIIVGQGALIEGDFAGMAAQDVAPADSIIHMVDGICMVTREPLDRLQQIVAQSWYWIGGFCAPSDTLTNPSVVPTATNAAFKRAVMVEHVG
jgi:N4-gp56 family major capsid protein